MSTTYPKHFKIQTALLLLACLLQIILGYYALIVGSTDLFAPVFLLMYSTILLTPIVAIFSLVLQRRLNTNKPILLISKIMRCHPDWIFICVPMLVLIVTFSLEVVFGDLIKYDFSY